MRFRSRAGGTREALDLTGLAEPIFVGIDAVEDGRKLLSRAGL